MFHSIELIMGGKKEKDKQTKVFGNAIMYLIHYVTFISARELLHIRANQKKVAFS